MRTKEKGLIGGSQWGSNQRTPNDTSYLADSTFRLNGTNGEDRTQSVQKPYKRRVPKGDGSVYRRGSNPTYYYKVPDPNKRGSFLCGPCGTKDLAEALLVKNAKLGSRPVQYDHAAIAEAHGVVRNRAGFDGDSRVYFIASVKIGAVKIGVTTNVASRLDSLQTSSPYEFSISLVIPGDVRLEKDLHRAFARQHMRGEWFRLDRTISQFIAEIQAQGGAK